MLLSIITHHRTDPHGYMGDSLWRMRTCVGRWCRIITELQAAGLRADDVEIVCCDWGGATSLSAALGQLGHPLKYVCVPRDVAKAADGDSEYSSSHATNVAVRRTTGRYLLYLDVDVYFLPQTMRTLLGHLSAGTLGGHDLSSAFYWGSRRHVPKTVIDGRPDVATLDDYVSRYHDQLKRDVLNKQDFMGAATALLATRDMWFGVGGFNEALRYWGFNDIDLHARLKMRYRFGGDLEDHGMFFYHLEHYATRNMSVENPRRANPMTMPSSCEINGQHWGLDGCDLKLVAG